MIRSGDTVHNPVTGEVIRFVETAADTGGEYVLIEVVVEPNGAVAAAHVHPYQTETFEILEGEVTFKAGKETIVAKAGETVRVDSGTPHEFWNAGETDARFRTGDPSGAAVRVAHRDDVRSRERRQDEPQGHAEPASARGHRECPLRRRAAPVPASVDPEGGPRSGLPARPAPGLQADLRVVLAPETRLLLSSQLTQRRGARRSGARCSLPSNEPGPAMP